MSSPNSALAFFASGTPPEAQKEIFDFAREHDLPQNDPILQALCLLRFEKETNKKITEERINCLIDAENVFFSNAKKNEKKIAAKIDEITAAAAEIGKTKIESAAFFYKLEKKIEDSFSEIEAKIAFLEQKTRTQNWVLLTALIVGIVIGLCF